MTHEPLPAQGPVDVNVRALAEKLTVLARRGHYYCEDSWYSCPKAEGGCAKDGEGDECNCGADEHNTKVAEVSAQLLAALCPNALAQGREPHRGEASPGATGSTTPGNHGEKA